MGGMAEHSGDVQSHPWRTWPLPESPEGMTCKRGRIGSMGPLGAAWYRGEKVERGRLCYTMTSSPGTHSVLLPHLLPHLLYLLLASPLLTSKC